MPSRIIPCRIIGRTASLGVCNTKWLIRQEPPPSRRPRVLSSSVDLCRRLESVQECYPGSMEVGFADVIVARWNPLGCFNGLSVHFSPRVLGGGHRPRLVMVTCHPLAPWLARRRFSPSYVDATHVPTRVVPHTIRNTNPVHQRDAHPRRPPTQRPLRNHRQVIVGHVRVQDGTRSESLTGFIDAAAVIIYRNETKQIDGARLLIAGDEHEPRLDVPREDPEELR